MYPLILKAFSTLIGPSTAGTILLSKAASHPHHSSNASSDRETGNLRTCLRMARQHHANSVSCNDSKIPETAPSLGDVATNLNEI